jgi:hypothetical protein
MEIRCFKCFAHIRYELPFRYLVSESFFRSYCEDISDSHFEAENTYNKNFEFWNPMFKECVEKLNTSDFSDICFDKHFMVKFPYLLLPFASVETMTNFARLNYDWKLHADYLVKCTIFANSGEDICNKLEVLRGHFGIDYLQFGLNFVRDIPEKYAKYYYPKIPYLMDLGFTFEPNFFTLHLGQVLHLDDDIVQQLVDCGLDLKENIKKCDNLFYLRPEQLDKLLKFYPDPDFVTTCILKNTQNALIDSLKHMSKNYGADLSAIIADC